MSSRVGHSLIFLFFHGRQKTCHFVYFCIPVSRHEALRRNFSVPREHAQRPLEVTRATRWRLNCLRYARPAEARPKARGQRLAAALLSINSMEELACAKCMHSDHHNDFRIHYL